ncbi:hypothetical protein ABEB36_012682 [Hypothenemus hampei]|uniref:HAT C-terminal dimerisation domain-containing protein n=1 Tax=Hypothenemus hampei TaxID=57062 RepID=A0ABD1EET9_HYPHA
MLQNPSNYLYFVILKPILYEMNNTNLNFQKDFVEIGQAFDDLQNLITFLAQKVVKEEFLIFELVLKHFDNELSNVNPKKTIFGIDFQLALVETKIDENALLDLQLRMSRYKSRLLTDLIQRLPDRLKYFKTIKALSPQICLSQCARYKFEHLPFLDAFIEKTKLGIIENQYNSLIDVRWKDIYGEEAIASSYKFWPIVLHHKNAGGTQIFNDLANYVILILSFPSSNAVVERVFSIMNATKTKLRNKMGIQMLNSILLIKSKMFAEKKCCTRFKCTKKMINKFNNSMYNLQNENYDLMTASSSNNNNNSDDDDLSFAIEIVGDEFDVPCLTL